ncbi:hypothetical protein OC842_007673, partial [Tilletia horrida]
LCHLAISALAASGVHESQECSRLASYLVPVLASHVLQYLRGGTHEANARLLEDHDAIAYGRRNAPLAPFVATALYTALSDRAQLSTAQKEATLLRTMLSTAQEQRERAQDALRDASAKANEDVQQLRNALQQAQDRLKEAEKRAEAAARAATLDRTQTNLLRTALDAAKAQADAAVRAQKVERDQTDHLHALLVTTQEQTAAATDALKERSSQVEQLSAALASERVQVEKLRTAHAESKEEVAKQLQHVQQQHQSKIREAIDQAVIQTQKDDQVVILMLEDKIETLEAAATEAGRTTLESHRKELAKQEKELHSLRSASSDMQKELDGLSQNIAEAWPMSYWPTRCVGFGTHGSVFAAEDLNDRLRTVAIKRSTAASDGSPTNAVRREMEVLHAVSSKNVVNLLDHFTVPTNPQIVALVLPYAPFDLAGVIHNSAVALPPPLIKKYAWQILTGLEAVHRAGYLHGDLKHANILVHDNHLIQITDFGMAEPIQTPSARLVLYSRNYRPPEILLRCRQRTAAADVWSFGCILAEMIGRRIAFTGHSALQTLNRILDHVGADNPLFPDADKAPGAFDGSDEASDVQPPPRGVTHFAARPRKLPASLQITFDPHHEGNLLNLRDTCLRVNPAVRPEIASLLKHAVFRSASSYSAIQNYQPPPLRGEARLQDVERFMY